MNPDKMTIEQEIADLERRNLPGLAAILRTHAENKWHEAVSFEQLMDEDERDYRAWLEKQKQSPGSSSGN